MTDIEAIKTDRDAGTPGPWVSGVMTEEGPWAVGDDQCKVIARMAMPPCSFNEINARRIARVPEMEDTIIAQTDRISALEAEVARLREALADAVGALDAAGEELSEFASIMSREPWEANLTYEAANDARAALAGPQS